MTKFIFILIIIFNSQRTSECSLKSISGKEALERNDYVNSLKLLLEAKSIAKQQNNEECLYKILNNIGVNYGRLLNYNEALHYYLEAYEIAINLGEKQEITVLNNIAILFAEDKDYNQAEKYFLKSYKIAKNNKYKLIRGRIAFNLGELNMDMQKWEISKQYFEEAISLFKLEPNSLAISKNYYCAILIHFGRYEEAQTIITPLLPEISNKPITELEAKTLFNYSKIKKGERDYKKAIKYAQEALKIKGYIELKYKIYSYLSNLYTITAAYEDASKAKDSSIAYYIKNNEKIAAREYESNKMKFEIKAYQHSINEQKNKYNSQQKLLYFSTISLLIIILLSIWIIYSLKEKNKQKKIIITNTNDILKLENEKLKNEIELRNKELAVKALNHSSRNSLINSIIKDLENLPEYNSSNSIKTQIEKIKKSLKLEKDWNEFTKRFNEINQDLLTKLMELHPSLNSNDLRFISYAYMNLSTKEIAVILNITDAASRKRRERISQKLKLAPNTTLYNYITKLN